MKYTAIIHLREQPLPVARLTIEPMLRSIRGVDDLDFVPVESLIAVGFDATQTTIAEIVRMIEDCGAAVAAVAQRRREVRKVG